MFDIDVASFKSELNKEINEYYDGFSKAITGAALVGWDKVVLLTRVDTGRARASWNLSTSPDDFIELPIAPSGYRIYGDPHRPTVRFNIDDDEGIYLSNNVEYIEKLEGLDGMVQATSTTISRSLNVRLTNIRKRG